MELGSFFICAAMTLVVASQARNLETPGNTVFDLSRFLEKVLRVAQVKLTFPPSGSISSLKVGSVESTNDQCKDWADWCGNYKPYCQYSQVSQYCPRTCEKCPKPTVAADESCTDLHSQCAYAAKRNYCTGNTDQVNFMKKYCKQTCNFCGPTCQDTSSADYCLRMLEGGYCKKTQYKTFFEKNCAKTCGYCDKQKNECGVAKLRAGKNRSPIVGGVNAQKGFYPWQVAIYYQSKFLCGGTLIKKRYVLTAAHCFNKRSTDVRQYKVVLGDYNRQTNEDTEETYYLEKIKIHEGYVENFDNHDITLLKLIPDVEFTDLIQPACLPSEGNQLPLGTKCYLSGWGKTSFDGEAVDILQEVEAPVVQNSVCESRNAFNFHQVTDKMICTGHNNGVDFSSGCHGDSGGPLSCERSPGIWTIEGVVSWGSPLCNGLDRYTVFTRVSSYKTWIDTNTSD